MCTFKKEILKIIFGQVQEESDASSQNWDKPLKALFWFRLWSRGQMVDVWKTMHMKKKRQATINLWPATCVLIHVNCNSYLLSGNWLNSFFLKLDWKKEKEIKFSTAAQYTTIYNNEIKRKNKWDLSCIYMRIYKYLKELPLFIQKYSQLPLLVLS